MEYLGDPSPVPDASSNGLAGLVGCDIRKSVFGRLFRRRFRRAWLVVAVAWLGCGDGRPMVLLDGSVPPDAGAMETGVAAPAAVAPVEPTCASGWTRVDIADGARHVDPGTAIPHATAASTR